MNDRYLFRGKRVGNGEWVEGYYVCLNVDRHFIYTGYAETDCGTYYPDCHEVIPETVGQCTGLKDKNGKLIFEGDIAKFKRFGNSRIGKILFNHKTAGFEFWWNVAVGAYGEKATHNANLSVCDEIEVIGNIHDNPELLEVKE